VGEIFVECKPNLDNLQFGLYIFISFIKFLGEKPAYIQYGPQCALQFHIGWSAHREEWRHFIIKYEDEPQGERRCCGIRAYSDNKASKSVRSRWEEKKTNNISYAAVAYRLHIALGMRIYT